MDPVEGEMPKMVAGHEVSLPFILTSLEKFHSDSRPSIFGTLKRWLIDGNVAMFAQGAFETEPVCGAKSALMVQPVREWLI